MRFIALLVSLFVAFPAHAAGPLIWSGGGQAKALNTGTLTFASGRTTADTREINMAVNGSAEDPSLARWTDGTSHTISRVTSGSPLSPVTTTAFSISATANAVESSTSGSYHTVATVPTGLYNRKLKVQFYYTAATAADTWAISVYTGGVRQSLSTDASSVTTIPTGVTGGLFTTTFDTTSATSYTINVTRTAGSGTTTFIATGIIVGPGIQPQGAVVTGSIAWTPTGTWTTNTTYTGRYERSGNKLKARVEISLSGAPSGAATVNLPSGLTIDETALVIASANVRYVGDAYIFDASGSNRYASKVVYNQGSTGSVLVRYLEQSANTVTTIDRGISAVTATAPITFATGDIIELDFEVPIAEWAGSGTVNLAQNDVSWAADDGTNDVFGPNGALVPNVAFATGTTDRVFSFPTGRQDTDLYLLEYNDTGSGWALAADFVPYSRGNNVSSSNHYGIRGWWTSATAFTVRFGNQGATVSASNASNGAGEWSAQFTAGSRFRVRKIAGGNAVGFGLATQTSSGLIPTYVKGTFAPALVKASGAGTLGTATVEFARYVKVGSLCFVDMVITPITITVGTVLLDFTLPFPAKSGNRPLFHSVDNSTPNTGRVLLTTGSSNASVTPSLTSSAWAVSAASSSIRASFSYEVNE